MKELEKKIKSTSLLVKELEGKLKSAKFELEVLESSIQPTTSEILRDFDKYFDVSRKKRRYTKTMYGESGDIYGDETEGIVCKVTSRIRIYITSDQETFLRAYVKNLHQTEHVEFIIK